MLPLNTMSSCDDKFRFIDGTSTEMVELPSPQLLQGNYEREFVS